MSKQPPNFRYIETNNCLKCIHSGWLKGFYICKAHDQYKIDKGESLPTECVCDDFEDSNDE